MRDFTDEERRGYQTFLDGFFPNGDDPLDALRAEREEAKATIARQREWIEKTGHRPACYARECEVCGYTQGPHEWDVIRMGHKFQPGPCTCGWADLVGG